MYLKNFLFPGLDRGVSGVRTKTLAIHIMLAYSFLLLSRSVYNVLNTFEKWRNGLKLSYFLLCIFPTFSFAKFLPKIDLENDVYCAYEFNQNFLASSWAPAGGGGRGGSFPPPRNRKNCRRKMVLFSRAV